LPEFELLNIPQPSTPAIAVAVQRARINPRSSI
jgi:hypothetical protein